jgi:iron complex transport system permease protein
VHPARALPLLVTLSILGLFGAWFNLSTGPVPLSLGEALHQPDSLAAQILWDLRLPRMMTAFITGALLGVAGTLMQVLLRNPLADPYILGVSGGASVGALLMIMTGAGTLALQGGAFAGALISMLLVFSLAHGRGGWDTTRLLLTGVVLAAGWGAVISLLLALSADTRLQGMLFWPSRRRLICWPPANFRPRRSGLPWRACAYSSISPPRWQPPPP